MVFKHAYLLPVLFALLMPVTFIITYTSAVLNQNVKPVFPYISDTGSWSPESCIFGLLLTFGALLLSLIVYVRYRQVRDLCEKNEFKPLIKKINTLTLYIGFCASLGIVVVASFQETNAFVVHLLGAGMCFGLGSIYHIIQVIISFSLYPTFGKKSLNIYRLICTILYFVTLSLTAIFLVLSLLKFKGDDITKWVEEDGGYDLHLVSTIAEWIMVAFNQLIILTLAFEFKYIQFSEPKINTDLG
ncbi:DNA damage-regulated autophagy modulator protein 2 [Anoplophora glabripennis]|nr:DNA damage-regulated autophagy modulator protein 2 [Anoplophora glabripennis]